MTLVCVSCQKPIRFGQTYLRVYHQESAEAPETSWPVHTEHFASTSPPPAPGWGAPA